MNEQKKHKKVVTYFRRVIQVVCFLILPALFIQIFLSIKAIMMLVLHHQGTFQAVLPNIILLAVATIVTVFAGRFFCGWMCAFGSMGDFLYRLPRLKNKNSHKYLKQADPILKWIKYLIFGVIVILIWGLQLVSIPSGTNPWDVFGMLVSFGNWPSVNDLIKGWIPATMILLLIMVASLFIERFFCRYLCPLGAYFSIISKFRPIAIVKKRDNCGNCSLCTQKCSMGIDLRKVDKVSSGECINCMECTIHCPRGNAHVDLSGENMNVLVAGTLSCALVAGSYYLGNFSESQLSSSSGNSYSSTASADTIAGIAADISDGTYTGSGNGFRGQTTVSVEVSSGVITGINIKSTSDDSEYINKASSTIISEIISSQSTNVDTVSGATFSSNGIISAVKAALSSGESGNSSSTDTGAVSITPQAANTGSDNSNSTSDTKSSSLNLKDGTYEGSGTGFRGETKVTVEVSKGKISKISIDSYQDDQQFFDRASATVIQEMIDNQSVNVDAVSGATYSSNGIKEAVANALNLDYTASTIQNEGHGHGNRFN
ncbi:MAG TPA: FMN-binding protein [Mobilitalea sp.]|nr:FMN-binding protein [Mobilitalea sp.]